MTNLLPNLIQGFFDANGNPLVGGKVFSYQAGTSTPLATYTDGTGNTENTNPIILDSNGQASIWIGPDAYKFVIKDANDIVLRTVDNVEWIPERSITSGKIGIGEVKAENIGDGEVGTYEIADNAVTTDKIPDNAITSDKIPDASIGIEKFESSAPLVLKETLNSQVGGGPRIWPYYAWATPTLLANPAALAGGDGMGCAFDPMGEILAFSENASSFASIFSRFQSQWTKTAGLDLAPAAGSRAVAWSPDGQMLVFARAASPYFQLYQRYGKTFKLWSAAGDTFPTGQANAVAFSPDGLYCAVAHNTSPYLTIYKVTTKDEPVTARYMTDNNTSLAGATPKVVNFEDLDYDPAGVVTTGTSWQFKAPRVDGYSINSWLSTIATTYAIADVNTLYATINSSPAGNLGAWTAMTTTSVPSKFGGGDWHRLSAMDILQIVVLMAKATDIDTSDQYNHVSIVGDIKDLPIPFFTKQTDPATLPGGNATSLAWSPDGTLLAVGTIASPYITIYSRNLSTGVFTKLADPGTLPAGQINGMSWSPDGKFLALALDGTPYVQIYEVSGTTFTMLTISISTLPSGSANAVAWGPTGENLAVAHNVTPYLSVYAWDGSATLTKYADPQFLPAGNAKALSWTPNGQMLAVAHTSSPYLTTYKTASTFAEDATLFMKAVQDV